MMVLLVLIPVAIYLAWRSRLVRVQRARQRLGVLQALEGHGISERQQHFLLLFDTRGQQARDQFDFIGLLVAGMRLRLLQHAAMHIPGTARAGQQHAHHHEQQQATQQRSQPSTRQQTAFVGEACGTGKIGIKGHGRRANQCAANISSACGRP